jgi:predicted TIM-barrel fold metal-dependent hydrolase
MDRVFDVHVHYPAGSIMGFADRLGRPDNVSERDRRNALEAVVAQCESAGIVKSCLLGGWCRVNAWVLEACRLYPSLFLPLAYLDLDQGTPDTVEKIKGEGFKGVKLNFPRRNYDDPAYMPLYERLCRHGLVLLFHTGVSGGSEDYLDQDPRASSGAGSEFETSFASLGTSSARMRALYLDTIAMAFPELRIIGAHVGYGEYDLACAVARWRRNVYFDLSGGDVVRRHLRERGIIGREISANKLCFGSDCATPSIAAEVEIWKRQLSDAGLDGTAAEKVLYGNAAWLFGVAQGQ